MLRTVSVIAAIYSTGVITNIPQFSNAQQSGVIFGCPPKHVYDKTAKACISEVTTEVLSECPEGYTVQEHDSALCEREERHQPVKSCIENSSLVEDGSVCQTRIVVPPVEAICPSGYRDVVHTDGTLGCIRRVVSKKKKGCKDGYTFSLAEGCVKDSEESVYWECKQFGAVSRGRMCQFEQLANSVCPEGYEASESSRHHCKRTAGFAGLASIEVEAEKVCPKGYSPSARGCSRLRQIDAEPSCRAGASLVNSTSGPGCVRSASRPLELVCPKDTAPCQEDKDSCCAEEVIKRTHTCKHNEEYDETTGECVVIATTEAMLSCSQGGQLTMNGSDPVCVERKTKAARKSCEKGEARGGKCVNRTTTEPVMLCVDESHDYNPESEECEERSGAWGRRWRRWHADRNARRESAKHRLR